MIENFKISFRFLILSVTAQQEERARMLREMSVEGDAFVVPLNISFSPTSSLSVQDAYNFFGT
jgi:hypothetical protein